MAEIIDNYNLPTTPTGNTFEGVQFVLPTDVKYDLTDATVKIQVREKPGAEIVKEYISPTDLIITLPHTITLPEHLVEIAAGLWQWDMQITFSDGRVKTYIGGYWTIKPTITI